MDSKAVTAAVVAVVVLISVTRAYAGHYRYHENPALAHRVVRKYVIAEADCRTVDLRQAGAALLSATSECLVIVTKANSMACGIIGVDETTLEIRYSEQAKCVDVQRYLNKLPLKDVAR